MMKYKLNIVALTIFVMFLFTGCVALESLSKTETATNSSEIELLEAEQVNNDSSEISIVEGSGTQTDSTLSDTLSRQFAHQAITEAGKYIILADSMMIEGDSLDAEYALVEAIMILTMSLDRFYLPDRLAGIDSLAAWSMKYSSYFGGDYQEFAPGEAGIADVDLTPEFADSLTLEEDSFYTGLQIDTTHMVLEIDSVYAHLDQLPGIPDTLNSKVQNFIDYFTGNPKGRKAMEVWLSRAGSVIPRMIPVLRRNGMPEDLVFLAMIESGFKTDARSYARAVGPWQFIYSTGKTYNLQANWWYDERRDVEKATAAASGFLRDLYEHLGDWYLALSAYNCGEGRVWREIRRSGGKDFWKMRKLPKQTRGYVPIFLAARKIARNPEEYGFEPIQYVSKPPRDSVVVNECIELKALAEVLEIELAELQSLNASLIRWCTPPNVDSTIVYLPAGKAEGFEEIYASIPDSKKTDWVRHKVKNGESLSAIAEKYRTSMRAIMDVPANNLSNPNKIGAGKYILVPVAPKGNYDFGSVNYADDPELPSGMQKQYHQVRPGDTLSEIAERYHVGLSKLLRWNNLHKRSVIRPGQKLVLYQASTNSSGGSNKYAGGDVLTQADGTKVYKVQSGDSPWLIAQRFKISVEDLLNANNMNKNSKIHPNQELIIPSHATITTSQHYTVRSGDTLSSISQQYGVSVDNLKNWNGLLNANDLQIGQTLIVRQEG